LASFFDQRIRSERLRLSQEWQASTTQRRARQPGVRSLSVISSPRVRMCGREAAPAGELVHPEIVVAAVEAQPLRQLRRRLGPLDRNGVERRR
jgi:hypothetical protein